MTKVERLAAIFGIAFAVIYAPTMDYNWTFATYHPIQGIWQLGRAPPLGGGSPAMYWYGFVITAALGALALTAIAALVPDKPACRGGASFGWCRLARSSTLDTYFSRTPRRLKFCRPRSEDRGELVALRGAVSLRRARRFAF